MAAVPGHGIGKEVLDAIGGPQNCREFSIRFPCDGVVTVKAEYFINEEQAQRLKTMLQNYELHPKGDPEIIKDVYYGKGTDEQPSG